MEGLDKVVKLKAKDTSKMTSEEKSAHAEALKKAEKAMEEAKKAKEAKSAAEAAEASKEKADGAADKSKSEAESKASDAADAKKTAEEAAEEEKKANMSAEDVAKSLKEWKAKLSAATSARKASASKLATHAKADVELPKLKSTTSASLDALHKDIDTEHEAMEKVKDLDEQSKKAAGDAKAKKAEMGKPRLRMRKRPKK